MPPGVGTEGSSRGTLDARPRWPTAARTRRRPRAARRVVVAGDQGEPPAVASRRTGGREQVVAVDAAWSGDGRSRDTRQDGGGIGRGSRSNGPAANPRTAARRAPRGGTNGPCSGPGGRPAGGRRARLGRADHRGSSPRRAGPARRRRRGAAPGDRHRPRSPRCQPAITMATSVKNSPNGGSPSSAAVPTSSGRARSGRRASSPRTSSVGCCPRWPGSGRRPRT